MTEAVPCTPERQANATFALLTSPGPAAIAVARLRGPGAPEFLRRHVRLTREAGERGLQAGDVRRAELIGSAGDVLDDVILSVHAQPPEWDVHLHLHGNPWLVRCCRRLLVERGFTETRETASTLWRCADTLEAEVYALLPEVLTLEGADWLLQQPGRLREALERLTATGSLEEQRVACRQLAERNRIVQWFTRPARVALVGPPNAGKSTLANALADQSVSLVSPHPGTTRDWVEVHGQALGFPITWVDTAGLRYAADPVEQAAVSRTVQWARTADAIVIVLDGTRASADARAAFVGEYGELRPACVAVNKADLVVDLVSLSGALPERWRDQLVEVSATLRTHLDELCRSVIAALNRHWPDLSRPGAFTDRQGALLNAAGNAASPDALHALLRECLAGPSAAQGRPTSPVADRAAQPI